tara:strand:- start:221 stop:418 length:198 start_codon:yes stop_codon:yes gene_type:complete
MFAISSVSRSISCNNLIRLSSTKSETIGDFLKRLEVDPKTPKHIREKIKKKLENEKYENKENRKE